MLVGLVWLGGVTREIRGGLGGGGGGGEEGTYL